MNSKSKLKSNFMSPLGNIVIEGDENGVSALCFAPAEKFLKEQSSLAIEKAKNWLEKYFSGKNPEIDFSLAPQGTSFQKAVWAELEKIPYGATCTYGQLAAKVATKLGKQKMSARAVGRAVGQNPIAILLPCHRVVGANGKLTGYAWGLERKAKLLEMERFKQ